MALTALWLSIAAQPCGLAFVKENASEILANAHIRPGCLEGYLLSVDDADRARMLATVRDQAYESSWFHPIRMRREIVETVSRSPKDGPLRRTLMPILNEALAIPVDNSVEVVQAWCFGSTTPECTQARAQRFAMEHVRQAQADHYELRRDWRTLAFHAVGASLWMVALARASEDNRKAMSAVSSTVVSGLASGTLATLLPDDGPLSGLALYLAGIPAGLLGGSAGLWWGLRDKSRRAHLTEGGVLSLTYLITVGVILRAD